MPHKHEKCWRLSILLQDMCSILICAGQQTSLNDHIFHISQTSASVLSLSQNIMRQLVSRWCKSPTRCSMMKTSEEPSQPRAKPRESTSPSLVLHRSIRKQNLKYLQEPREKLQSWNRKMDREEIRTEQRRWFCELPDSPRNVSYASKTNENDEDDFDCGSVPIHQPSDRDETNRVAVETKPITVVEAITKLVESKEAIRGGMMQRGSNNSSHLRGGIPRRKIYRTGSFS